MFGKEVFMLVTVLVSVFGLASDDVQAQFGCCECDKPAGTAAACDNSVTQESCAQSCSNGNWHRCTWCPIQNCAAGNTCTCTDPVIFHCGTGAVSWEEDFENVPCEALPDGWVDAGGNSEFGVDCTVAGQGERSLREFGVPNGNLAATVASPIDPEMGNPGIFWLEFTIRNGSESILPGPHDFRAQIQMKADPDWTSPGGRVIFRSEENGTLIGADGTTTIGAIADLSWDTVRIGYLRKGSEVHFDYWLNGTFAATLQVPAEPNEEGFGWFLWEAGAGSVWYDGITLEKGSNTFDYPLSDYLLAYDWPIRVPGHPTLWQYGYSLSVPFSGVPVSSFEVELKPEVCPTLTGFDLPVGWTTNLAYDATSCLITFQTSSDPAQPGTTVKPFRVQSIRGPGVRDAGIPASSGTLLRNGAWFFQGQVLGPCQVPQQLRGMVQGTISLHQTAKWPGRFLRIDPLNDVDGFGATLTNVGWYRTGFHHSACKRGEPDECVAVTKIVLFWDADPSLLGGNKWDWTFELYNETPLWVNMIPNSRFNVVPAWQALWPGGNWTQISYLLLDDWRGRNVPVKMGDWPRQLRIDLAWDAAGFIKWGLAPGSFNWRFYVNLGHPVPGSYDFHMNPFYGAPPEIPLVEEPETGPWGGCCIEGVCVPDMTDGECLIEGGHYFGDGTSCTSPRACCFPDACFDVDPVCCDGMGGYPMVGECPDACAVPPPCPGSGGDCCRSNGTPGCEDSNCCTRVCVYDPYCCAVAWDDICASLAQADPGCTCEAPPGCGDVGSGDCCTAGETPGCANGNCCQSVCSYDSYCCEVEWDAQCVLEAGAEVSCACRSWEEIPTVSEWGLVILTLLLLTGLKIRFGRAGKSPA